MFAKRPIQTNVWLTVFTSDSLLSFSARRIFAPFEEPSFRSRIYLILGGELIQKEIPMGKTTLLIEQMAEKCTALLVDFVALFCSNIIFR